MLRANVSDQGVKAAQVVDESQEARPRTQPYRCTERPVPRRSRAASVESWRGGARYLRAVATSEILPPLTHHVGGLWQDEGRRANAGPSLSGAGGVGPDVGAYDLLVEVPGRGKAFDVELLDVTRTNEGGRNAAQADDPAVVRGDSSAKVEPPVFRIEGRDVERQFDPAIARLSDIQELHAREAARWPERRGDDRVVDVLVVEGELDTEALFEQPCIEAELSLLADLGLEIDVAEVARGDSAQTGRSDCGAIRLNGREDIGLQAGPSPCSAEFELREKLQVGEEGFLGQNPRRAELGIIDRLEVGAERAVSIGAKRRGDERPVLPRDLLLAVHSKGLILLERFDRVAARAAAHVTRPGDRELEALRNLLLELLVVVLHTGRCGRDQVRGDLPVGSGTVVGRKEGAPQCHGLLLAQARGKERVVARGIAEDELIGLVIRKVRSDGQAVA